MHFIPQARELSYAFGPPTSYLQHSDDSFTDAIPLSGTKDDVLLCVCDVETQYQWHPGIQGQRHANVIKEHLHNTALQLCRLHSGSACIVYQ